MRTALDISASGLRHADARQRAVAHNTANASTPETVVLRVTGRDAGGGRGVQTLAGGDLERRASTGPAPAAQDPARLAVESRAAARGARANAVAVRAADAMLGTLLDAVG